VRVMHRIVQCVPFGLFASHNTKWCGLKEFSHRTKWMNDKRTALRVHSKWMEHSGTETWKKKEEKWSKMWLWYKEFIHSLIPAWSFFVQSLRRQMERGMRTKAMMKKSRIKPYLNKKDIIFCILTRYCFLCCKNVLIFSSSIHYLTQFVW